MHTSPQWNVSACWRSLVFEGMLCAATVYLSLAAPRSHTPSHPALFRTPWPLCGDRSLSFLSLFSYFEKLHPIPLEPKYFASPRSLPPACALAPRPHPPHITQHLRPARRASPLVFCADIAAMRCVLIAALALSLACCAAAQNWIHVPTPATDDVVTHGETVTVSRGSVFGDILSILMREREGQGGFSFILHQPPLSASYLACRARCAAEPLHPGPTPRRAAARQLSAAAVRHNARCAAFTAARTSSRSCFSGFLSLLPLARADRARTWRGSHAPSPAVAIFLCSARFFCVFFRWFLLLRVCGPCAFLSCVWSYDKLLFFLLLLHVLLLPLPLFQLTPIPPHNSSPGELAGARLRQCKGAGFLCHQGWHSRQRLENQGQGQPRISDLRQLQLDSQQQLCLWPLSNK